MIAAEVSLRTGREKLSSFSLSNKNTKSGILGNATENILIILRHLTNSFCRQDRKIWASDGNVQGQGGNSGIPIHTEEVHSNTPQGLVQRPS